MAEARNLAKLGYRFETFIGSLFGHLGFNVNENADPLDTSPDLVVRAGSSFAVVEVKLYSSITPSSRSILQALEHLEHARNLSAATYGILATNSRVLLSQLVQLERFPNLRIFDFDILAALVVQEPRLTQELEDISRGALVFRGEALPTPQPSEVAGLLAELGAPFSHPQEKPEEPTNSQTTGAELCAAIHAAPSSIAKPFEKACEDAIRWLFADELVAFDNQHESHAGHHIFDLVARIASKEDFWQALITDFRARYIVFEFKNYADTITQREVYTTEKYLYPVAMRGAAVIISRHGSDAVAEQAMRGALRESGKLILGLSVDELCEMLAARDAGSDHLVTLVDKLDDILMGLER